MDLWYKEIEKRAKHFTTSDMTDAQELEIIQKAQNGMINTIIKKYGLRYFTSSLGQTIATLNPAGQL
jgi:hypothetical protein